MTRDEYSLMMRLVDEIERYAGGYVEAKIRDNVYTAQAMRAALESTREDFLLFDPARSGRGILSK